MNKFKNLADSAILVLLAVLWLPSHVGAASWKVAGGLSPQEEGAAMKQPVFIAVDGEKQRYYVVDPGAGKLLSFQEDGRYLSAFDAGGKLRTPVALARTAEGKLWIAERSSNRLLYVDVGTRQVRDFSPVHPDGTPLVTGAMAMDARNRLHVLDLSRGVVVRLDDNLLAVQVFSPGKDGLGFRDFKIKNDQLWALDRSGKVMRFSQEGNPAELIVLGKALQFPVSLEVDRSGLLYILDRHGGKISVFDRKGGHRFDLLDGGRRRGQIWYGAYLLFDWRERLCLVDEGNGRVEILDRL